MPWFKVDDNLALHQKVVAAGNDAMGLWVRAGAWSAQQLTDGFIPKHIVAVLGTSKQARRLVVAGLWNDEEGGFSFHAWDERQPSRDEVESKREAARERMRQVRASRAQSVRANTDERSRELRDASVREPRPDPTRPDPSLLPSEEARTTPPTSSGPPATKKGTRVPEPFPLTHELVAWAKEKAPKSNPDDHEAFMDYWRGVPGQKGVKLDWPGTWRNWMRKASTERTTGPRGRATSTPTERAAGVAEMAARVAARQQTHLRAIGDQ